MEDYNKDKTIHVLFVTHYAELLGANRSLLGVLSILQQNNHFSLSVLLPSKGGMTDALDDLGIPYKIFKYYQSFYVKKNLFSMIKGIVKEFLNFYVALILFFKLRRCRIDIIHTNSSVLNIGAYLSILLKTKHVWHFREFVKQHYESVSNLGERWQSMIWSKCANQIIVVSEALCNYYSSVLPQSPICTIYNGIDMTPSISLCSKSNDSIDIALVGVLHPQKHQDIVIRAIAEVVNQFHKLNVHLHIWGNSIDEEYENLLLKLVADNSLSKFVTFYGYKNDVIDKMKFCHIGIIASEYEAFGRVTIEYMLNGMIPIASRSGANIELIRDGENGFLFDLNAYKELAKIIIAIIDDYSSYKKIIENAELTAKCFSVKSTVDKLIFVYQKMFY